jgi:hypothetical protein
VGIAAYDLIEAGDRAQLGLAINEGHRARRLETTLDRLSERFGSGIVQRAAELIADRGVGIAANLDFLADRDEQEDA